MHGTLTTHHRMRTTYLQAFCPMCGGTLGATDVCDVHGAVREHDPAAVYCYWCGHAVHAWRTHRGRECGAVTARHRRCRCTGGHPTTWRIGR